MPDTEPGNPDSNPLRVPNIVLRLDCHKNALVSFQETYLLKRVPTRLPTSGAQVLFLKTQLPLEHQTRLTTSMGEISAQSCA